MILRWSLQTGVRYDGYMWSVEERVTNQPPQNLSIGVDDKIKCA